MDGGGEAAARRMVGSCGKAILNPIMMRFRPIAPKPVVGGSLSGGASSVESKNSTISKGRTKRKYVRVRRYNRKKKTTTTTTTRNTTASAAVTKTTLQLLPEREVVEITSGSGSNNNYQREIDDRNIVGRENDVVLVSDPKGRAVVELWVTVECVTDACMERLEIEETEIGCTDEERIKNLEEDTCPGFVSDGMNRVEWLNRAFKRMVKQRRRRRQQQERNNGESRSPATAAEEEEEEEKVEVWLIISKTKLPKMKRVFTCQIKLQFKRGTEIEKDSTKLVPCDAWRMDGGGFAWKLDVKAALTLAPLLQEDFHY